MNQQLSPSWPVLTSYDQSCLARIALPLGGIGTGTVSLGGRGDLRDWEIVNRPAKGFVPRLTQFAHAPFFAVWAKAAEEPAVVRALEGMIEPPYEGPMGAQVPNHGLPRFRNCEFHAAYPFGQVLLSDPDTPVAVRIEAFNPLIPADVDRSSIPAVILRFVISNLTHSTLEVSVCASVQNFIGSDGTVNGARGNVNDARQENDIAGIFMRSRGVDSQAEQWGTMALTTMATEISSRTAWAKLSWGDSLLDFWDDFSEDGSLEERDGDGVDAPMASLAVPLEITPESSEEVTFLLTWHFPNRMTWTPATKTDPACCDGDSCHGEGSPDWIGNYYTTCYRDAWEVAARTARELSALEADTLKFVRAFCDSSLPPVVKEAALYNLSTLRSQTCFRTADGHFYGWEGCGDKAGCCLGSCTHVWNYEQATAFLFGELAQSLREVEFLHSTRDDGHMSFRVFLPLARATEHGLAAADGQMGCLMKLYRDWQLCGDDAFLRRLWPRARRALEFCWLPGGWDANQDGVMEGCQHNTMDVEYYGPNPQMGAWYLGALRAAEEMARHLDEDDFAATCRDLFERGSHWLDAHLFNGDYYEHEIRPVENENDIAPGLRHESMGSQHLQEPAFQLGAGCLVDQLVGQYLSHVCGLGYLLDEDHVRTTLRSIMRYNFRESLHDHFNHMRSYALADESALLMATYPKGRRPKRPFPYYNEVMTGFEYAAAVHMLYEGQIDNGLKVIEAIRDRYDGRKRSPFDEAECGHHYARAMASWAAVLALSGFGWSGVSGTMTFAPKEGTHFWSNGSAWGTCRQALSGDAMQIHLEVLHGTLELKQLVLRGLGSREVSRTVAAGSSVNLVLEKR